SHEHQLRRCKLQSSRWPCSIRAKSEGRFSKADISAPPRVGVRFKVRAVDIAKCLKRASHCVDTLLPTRRLLLRVTRRFCVFAATLHSQERTTPCRAPSRHNRGLQSICGV